MTDQSILIPKDILFLPKKFTDEKIKEIINRLKFIDHSILLIVNEDGVEKMINLDNNFEEVGYNNRPLFNDIAVSEEDPEGKNFEFKSYPYYF